MDVEKGLFLAEEESLKNTGEWRQFTLYQRGLCYLRTRLTNIYNYTPFFPLWRWLELHKGWQNPAQVSRRKQALIVTKPNIGKKFSQYHPGFLKRFLHTDGIFNNSAIALKLIDRTLKRLLVECWKGFVVSKANTSPPPKNVWGRHWIDITDSASRP